MLAVYNLTMSNLIQWMVDPSGSTYWSKIRAQYGVTGSGGAAAPTVNGVTTPTLAGFVPGLVNSASDNGTSVGLTIPEGLSNLTIGQLQATNNPYGLQYLAWAQDVGTLWGMS